MADPCDRPTSLRDPRIEEPRRALARNWALLPLDGKIPKHKRWQKSPPADLSSVYRWLRKGHNLGLRTGKVSGVIVIDDDSPDGSASAALNLPKTVSVLTGSGKRHFYFQAPDFKVNNSVKTVGAGIDVRGDGGQVVYVGSIHPETQQPYVWAPGCSPEEVELAPLPDHLLAKLRPPEKRPKSELKLVMEDVEVLSNGSRRRVEHYVRAALEAEVDRVFASVEGQRNDTLNKSAFALGQLIGAGELQRTAAHEALHRAGIAIGLPESEVEATLNSGFAAGEREPRDLSDVIDNRAKLDALDAPPDGKEDQRPVIKIAGGFLHAVTDRAERILLRQHPPLFYQRGSTLVRITQIPQAAGDRTIKHRPSIQEVTTAAIVDHLTRLISWQKFDKKAEEYVCIDCPERVAMTLASRSGSWRLPLLSGVLDAPTLRPDGDPIAAEGYDRRSGLFLSLCGTRYPTIPNQPTRDDALAALGHLLTVLENFPFVSDADRSVAIAAILTSLVRPSLRTAPLFAFLASKMGSGKSLLADSVALIATGRPAAVMSQGADENEDKKRMLPILGEGDPVAVIDNIDRPFGSAALCSILTQATWRDRVLGKSQTLSLPTTNTTWLATGNNVVFVGDITTRTLVCELDPRCERPEERKFARNLHHFIPANRSELVSAGLTVLRAYHVAGRPPMDLTVFGRFEEWSDWVRSALVWLGHADPCITRSRVEANDPVRAELTAVLAALEQHFGSNAFRVSDVMAEVDDTLRAAVAPILATAATGQSPQQRLGIYFQSIERRPEGGSRLVRGATRSGAATWRIERV